ncbi:MAG: serpin family protein [Clostridia bacterium]|nr:serpin family protein [Clostridia bacterium]
MKKSTKLISLILAFILSAAALSGCVNTPPSGDPTHEPISSPTQSASEPTAVPNNSTIRLTGIRPANGTGAYAEGLPEKGYIDASNAFAAALVNAMGENWTGVVSPVSFGILLEMLANGADADQSVAIIKAMLSELGLDATNENAARLISVLTAPADTTAKQPGTPSKFNLNSAIIVSDSDSFTANFEKTLADHFKASIGNIDFNDTEKALATINGWVNEHTNGLIPELFDQIYPDTAMVLLNALYFNGTWKTPFVTFRGDPDTRGSEISMFNGVNGEQPISMLTATANYLCGEFDGDQVVLVPYADEEYYMAVILPRDGKAPSAALADTIGRFSECVSAPAYLAMPAIELSTSFDAIGSSVLDRLGLGDIANGSMQFPGIVEEGSIRLDQFVHAATLRVTESGTEAGAASGASGSKSAPSEPVYRVVCNRPYAMAIVHAETGAVLFASTVNEIPAGEYK